MSNVYINVYDDVYQIESDFKISKAREEEQLVFGWANISKNADGSIPLDWQGDITEIDVLEKAAYEYMKFYGQTGEMHKGKSFGKVVESIVFTKAKMEALGIPEGTVPEGWFIGFHIPDKEVFAKVKDGSYKMFSIQGCAKRVKI